TKTPEGSEKQPELPAQIELLETRVRFETNGDSRKEVHTRVHINHELGARQFARLSFDYNRSFQQIDFPLVRVTHTGGGHDDLKHRVVPTTPRHPLAPDFCREHTFDRSGVVSKEIFDLDLPAAPKTQL